MFAFAPISLFSFNLGPSVTGIGQIGKTTGPITKRRITPLQIPWHDPVEHPSDLSLLSWHNHISEYRMIAVVSGVPTRHNFSVVLGFLT